jgi:hypothetical protein
MNGGKNSTSDLNETRSLFLMSGAQVTTSGMELGAEPGQGRDHQMHVRQPRHARQHDAAVVTCRQKQVTLTLQDRYPGMNRLVYLGSAFK